MTENNIESVNYLETEKQLKHIRDWIDSLTFEKQLIGGVSEKDVWRKFLKLNRMYQELLNTEKIRYETLLEEYKNKDR